jgi:DNA-cytosine methyltransferase
MRPAPRSPPVRMRDKMGVDSTGDGSFGLGVVRVVVGEVTYGSVCSGIEAATVAWEPLGFKPVFYSEIDEFCSELLRHRYPGVINYGDFTKITAADAGWIDILIGGTPCQSFSVAGLRAGIRSPNGNLALEFVELVRRLRPRWVTWENVFGVTSSASHDAPDCIPPEDDLESGDGPADGQEIVVEDKYDADEISDFGVFLSALSELGYGYAWRTLDAQFSGGCKMHADEFGIGPVPQRRRRIFVVARSGVMGKAGKATSHGSAAAGTEEVPDLRRAMFLSASVLFERESLLWNSPKGHEAGQATAARSGKGAQGGGGVINALRAGGRPGASRTGDSRGQDPVLPCEYTPDLARTISTGESARQDWETCTFVVSEKVASGDGTRVSSFDWQSGGDVRHNITKDCSSNIQASQTPAIFVATEVTGSIGSSGAGTERAAGNENELDFLVTDSFAVNNTGQGWWNQSDVAAGIRLPNGGGSQEATFVAEPIAFDPAQITSKTNRSQPKPGSPSHSIHQSGPPMIAMGFYGNDSGQDAQDDVMPTIRSMEKGGGNQPSVAFQPDSGQEIPEEEPAFAFTQNQDGDVLTGNTAPALSTNSNATGRNSGKIMNSAMGVRRLTPIEVERCFGFQDSYTDILYKGKRASDSARYRALGNSICIPPLRWIGARIKMVDEF